MIIVILKRAKIIVDLSVSVNRCIEHLKTIKICFRKLEADKARSEVRFDQYLGPEM